MKGDSPYENVGLVIGIFGMAFESDAPDRLCSYTKEFCEVLEDVAGFSRGDPTGLRVAASRT